MKPSEKCKFAGLKNLNELSEMTGKHIQTLIRWDESDSIFFEIILRGAIDKKKSDAFNAMKRYDQL